MILLAVALMAGLSDRPDIPAAFAVCVTTVDAGGRARLDGYFNDEGDAKTRRAEILRDGWTTTGDEYDREDQYPPSSIVKATVDPTTINHHSCILPTLK